MPFNFLQYQQMAWTPPPQAVDPSINPSEYYPPFSDPIQTIKKNAIVGAFIALISAGPFIPPMGFEQPTADRYGAAWSEPIRLDLRTHLITAAQQFTAFQLDATQQLETITESRWHQPWSEPVRFKLGVSAADQPFQSFYEPNPVIPFEQWIYPWSEPVRIKPHLRTGLQYVLTESLLPLITPTTWYAILSEPVRQKLGLGAWLQQFDSLQVPVVPPASRLIQWYADLSEPVRLPTGLKAWLQQTLAWPPRMLPTPSVTATMAAVETNNDIALFGINVYSGVTPGVGASGANVSITEIPVENSGAASIEET